MDKIDIFQFKLNGNYYFVDQKIILLRIFEDIHMAKIRFLKTAKERIVDIKALSAEPIYEISISINLLGGERV